jgi:4-amino-4-deoxy-L-arabinose transferase-like glycosyltransferase
MKSQDLPRGDAELALIAQLAACVAFLTFLYYLRQGEILLYGDAVAHINIARRVFDSRTPGLLQLGTVWLPLPHLLMVPFLLWDDGWRTGISGSVPSMLTFIFGVAGIFRLVRGALSNYDSPTLPARRAAWIAAVVYAANPNLIYLQATAMTESLYLALFVWALVYFGEFVHAVGSIARDPKKKTAGDAETPVKPNSLLLKCGGCLAGACLTRYDGWFLAVAVCVAVLFVIRKRPALWRSALVFFLIAAAVPVLWLAYNAAVYRNPLEFANGPYSAKAIEQKTSTPGAPPHPGANNLPVAFTFFLKSAQLNMAQGNWGRLWVLLLLAGSALLLVRHRNWWPLLFFWLPAPFYMLSIAYSGVPMFLPPWWPYTIYNARYGVQLLPLFCICAALMTYSLLEISRSSRMKSAVGALSLTLIIASYAFVWRAQPICFREAWINSRSRISLENALAASLRKLPPSSRFLMYLGDHVGALQEAGIPLRRVINEGNHRPWKKPSDPEGLWELALADPSRYADFAIAMDGDAVDGSVSKDQLDPILVIRTQGQPRTVLYRTKSLSN